MYANDSPFSSSGRRLTIEEVSVIFDTGRMGSAKAAVEQFRVERTPEGVVENRSASMDKADLAHVETDLVKV